MTVASRRRHVEDLPVLCTSDIITSENSYLRVGGGLSIFGSGSAASKSLTHVCWKYGLSKEN